MCTCSCTTCSFFSFCERWIDAVCGTLFILIIILVCDTFHIFMYFVLTNCAHLLLCHLLFFLSLRDINWCVCGTLFILIIIFVCNTFYFFMYFVLTNCTYLLFCHLLFFLSLREINWCVCGTLFILIIIFVCKFAILSIFSCTLCSPTVHTWSFATCSFFFFLSLREMNWCVCGTLLYLTVASSFYSCYCSAYNYRQFSYVSCLSYVYIRYVSFTLFSLVMRDQLMLRWYYCLSIVLLLGLSIRQFKMGLLIITRNSF